MLLACVEGKMELYNLVLVWDSLSKPWLLEADFSVIGA